MMDYSYLYNKIDHTLLKPTTRRQDIEKLCDEALIYGFASVCIPPCYVAAAAERLQSRVPVCTVIGFPLGYNSRETKMAEASQALKDGATELDMVINIGRMLMDDEPYVYGEIAAIKALAGKNTVKVIIETCLLNEDQKILLCRLVTRAGADFIKTSTGFAGGGATVEDVRLLRQQVGSAVRVKAAGGIRTAEQAAALVEAGADRLGMSSALSAFGLAEPAERQVQ
ncbi:MAG: deoxyribose-phosphate aldolase [Clostridiaceae bacterium]|nr:deoxyribose-phosphate aldolase [Clostridiaceae bacterium]